MTRVNDFYFAYSLRVRPRDIFNYGKEKKKYKLSRSFIYLWKIDHFVIKRHGSLVIEKDF